MRSYTDPAVETASGYLHSRYSQSLNRVGRPRQLPRCGGWILERRIPAAPFYDAMGCYPLFACRDWSQLKADLADLAEDLVCLSMVTDPFGNYDDRLLRDSFPDKLIPFKQHFCIDCRRPPEDYVCRHHQRNARKALDHLYVERCWNPTQVVDDWTALYACLIERHGITGVATFSRAAFARQFEVPGLVVFQALYRGAPVGMLLWYVQNEVAYYHLGAHNALGYRLGSSFALFWRALECFRDNGLQWLDLGAGAGVSADGSDGLTRFKRGWATGTRPAYFCGRIFDRDKYAWIVEAKGVADTAYFPAYRKGEFA
jgi:hypothetical protein